MLSTYFSEVASRKTLSLSEFKERFVAVALLSTREAQVGVDARVHRLQTPALVEVGDCLIPFPLCSIELTQSAQRLGIVGIKSLGL